MNHRAKIIAISIAVAAGLMGIAYFAAAQVIGFIAKMHGS